MVDIKYIEQNFDTERKCMEFSIQKKQTLNLKYCKCGCNLSNLKCYESRSCFVCCCNNFIYPRKDLIFENSKLPLKTWFLAIAIFLNNSKITAERLRLELNINYKSAYYMLKKLKNEKNLISFFE
ncbi:hypothetical protein [Spiroplasma taiwanense]|uniref:Transposase n=1 Tax=Spiroplasma taiwanense CT-1 TaxID=1276220 RepID=S5LX35_9MOLU|nr:hypothetical protein [Spiroplasma taiwanense]AGR41186.1 hypothetical protein STAIW_v1c05640 [Spiroplasma taiwanense CT-1]